MNLICLTRQFMTGQAFDVKCLSLGVCKICQKKLVETVRLSRLMKANLVKASLTWESWWRVSGCLGGIFQKMRQFFIVLVESQEADTLLPVIKEKMKPGTTSICDCWRAYNCLEQEGSSTSL